VRLPAEQDAVLVVDDPDDDGRIGAREVLGAAVPTPAREPAVERVGLAPALAAPRVATVPLRDGGGGGGDVAFVVGQPRADLAEVVQLAVGPGLHGEDRGPLQESEQPVALVVVLDERLDQPQLGATVVGGEAGLVVELQQQGVGGSPHLCHPLVVPPMMVDTVELARPVPAQRPSGHPISLEQC
jgi:hypothetical protein